MQCRNHWLPSWNHFGQWKTKIYALQFVSDCNVRLNNGQNTTFSSAKQQNSSLRITLWMVLVYVRTEECVASADTSGLWIKKVFLLNETRNSEFEKCAKLMTLNLSDFENWFDVAPGLFSPTKQSKEIEKCFMMFHHITEHFKTTIRSCWVYINKANINSEK